MPTPTSLSSPPATPESNPDLPAGPTVSFPLPKVEPSTNFVAYESIAVSVEPAVSPYSTTLAGLVNSQAAAVLNPAQQAALEKNGFVVTSGSFVQIYELYQQAKTQQQPVFITTDALLHTYRVLYDFALRDAEINHFVADLTALTTEMLAQSQAQMASASADTQQAALRNLAYFSVASSLLDPAFTPAAEVADQVTAELALIESHSGFQPSPLFGFEEDYSQYVPRGHYTRNETFERYFRAMMWYGRIGFRLRPEQVEMGRMETRQAILMAIALGTATVNDEPALAVWKRIYEPTAFFVGYADDLTVYDYLSVMRNVYGETFNLPDLNDLTRLDTFIQQAAALRPPRIIGGPVTDQQDPAKITQSFRFMGQRFVPDAYIFQQLVYDKVGTRTKPRLMPSALDVASVLGSERAYELLLDVSEQGQYEHYTSQMEAVRAEFAELPPEQWTETLYWSWLYSLRPLLSPLAEGYPIFMQNPAWLDKDLQTFLGSWTELKHDTILYAKQSTTVETTGLRRQPQLVNGYVEPRPEIFARLAALANQTRRGLGEHNLLNSEVEGKFTQLEQLLLALMEIARKELTNQSLTEAEQAQIRNLGDTLETLNTFSEQTEQGLASAADERLALVADVHTDPNTQQALQVAIGDPAVIWVIAPVDGQPTLTQGGVFSFYEFTQPLANRLTDEAWQALQPKPEPPAWTASFIRP
jgi:hypothetical protein